MDDQPQSRRKFEVDGSDGNQLGAKCLRISESSVAENAALCSLDFKIPTMKLVAPILESESDGPYCSIYSTDRGFDEQCAIADSTFMDIKITDGIVKDTAFTENLYIDTDMLIKRPTNVCYSAVSAKPTHPLFGKK
jgi:hypothetical protein